ncbi:MAG: DNA cytosine methyltransferase, partial [Candidatus Sulfotelmatobacter sp.]
MKTYYNENDPFAAAWLRELMKRDVIPEGVVDERSITEVEAADLREFTQCHFFAGIGVWAYSLRQAGWPEDVECWTGSCPCQPFSMAGKRAGASDGRHLWPEWFERIRQRRPLTIFGEQVASDDGLAWLDLVSSDLENADYSCGAVDTCAAGFGAPHIRQRLYFVAVSDGGHPGAARIQRSGEHGFIAPHGGAGEMADAARRGSGAGFCDSGSGSERGIQSANGGDAGHHCFWSNAEWIYCRDDKYRPVEPGTFPLAHGIAGRVGRLRGYGNALVAPQA